jgi:hypothetical protein
VHLAVLLRYCDIEQRDIPNKERETLNPKLKSKPFLRTESKKFVLVISTSDFGVRIYNSSWILRNYRQREDKSRYERA